MQQCVWVRVPSGAPRRSKVRFAPTTFYTCGKKVVIRPLPCSSSPNRTRCRWASIWYCRFAAFFVSDRNINFNRPFGVSAAVAASTLRYFNCSGQINCPSAKVFACAENACTAQKRRPALGRLGSSPHPWGKGRHDLRSCLPFWVSAAVEACTPFDNPLPKGL